MAHTDKTAALRTKASCRREFARLKEMTRNNLPPGGRNLPVAGFERILIAVDERCQGAIFFRRGWPESLLRTEREPTMRS